MASFEIIMSKLMNSPFKARGGGGVEDAFDNDDEEFNRALQESVLVAANKVQTTNFIFLHFSILYFSLALFLASLLHFVFSFFAISDYFFLLPFKKKKFLYRFLLLANAT